MAATLYERLAPWSRLVVFTVPTVHGAVAHSLATLSAVLGRYEAADAHVRAALELHEALEAPFFIALTSLEWAQTMRERGGDPAPADAMLRRAQSIGAEHGYAGIEARVSRLLPAQPAS